MTVRKRTQMWLLVAAVIAVPGVFGARAQSIVESARTVPLNGAFPTDPQITSGAFANGIKYYLRTNRKPANRVELRLVVNAGSLMEDDDQRGLAHFVEHMAFNGTKRFPKMEVVSFMESAGMRFGPHVNAYTSFDETVYMLQVPTDKPVVVEKAMQILGDWAQSVSFDAVEIDKERGVVMEEWRLGRGADARMLDQQFPILLKDSRYADRLPIGKPEILQNFAHDRLRRFYTDWYRPEFMAVLAVGDFEKPAMEALLRSHFGAIPASASPKTRPVHRIPEQPGTRYTIVTDKETTQTSVGVYNIFQAREQSTIGAYRRQIVEGLYSGMLTSRLIEMAQKPDAPFLGAGAGRGLFVRSAEVTNLGALVKDGGVEAGLDALFAETERVVQFGFTAAELERTKKALMTQMDNLLTEKDTHESRVFAAEYIRNYLQGEPIPGIAFEHVLYQRFLPEITLAEVNALAKDWSPDRSRIVTVNTPDKPGVSVPTAARLGEVMAAASKRPLTAHVDNMGDLPLIESMPSGGTVVKTTANADAGVTEWELSNGVKVVMKPTTFKEDEIVFSAFSPGGTSLASDADYVAAVTAAQVIGSSGVGNFSMMDLGKQLMGKTASVSAFIDDTSEGFRGGSTRKDLETLFQLVFLEFTQPRADRNLFQVMTSQAKQALANQTVLPEYEYQKTLRDALSQGHFRARVPTPAWVDEMNLDKSFAFYKDRFADASDFTFVFVGSFSPDQLRPFAERYLASLPATRRKETWKDNGPKPPKNTVVDKRVEKGIEPKSQATIVFTGSFPWAPANRVAIRAMGDVLETRLRETLREELGGTYSVNVSPSYAKIPTPEYTVEIAFGCAPDRTDSLVKRVFAEIEKLKAAGPTEKQLADVREAMLRDWETNSKDNSYVLTNIAVRYEYKEDLKEFFTIPDLYRKLTASTIQAAAKSYLNTKNYVQVTLFPEKKP